MVRVEVEPQGAEAEEHNSSRQAERHSSGCVNGMEQMHVVFPASEAWRTALMPHAKQLTHLSTAPHVRD